MIRDRNDHSTMPDTTPSSLILPTITVSAPPDYKQGWGSWTVFPEWEGRVDWKVATPTPTTSNPFTVPATKVSPAPSGRYQEDGRTYYAQITCPWNYVEGVWVFRRLNGLRWRELVEQSVDCRFREDARMVWVRERVEGIRFKRGEKPRGPFPPEVRIPMVNMTGWVHQAARDQGVW